MRVGDKTNPGISAGTGGVSTAYHAALEERLAVGSDQLIEGEWNHLALVVNRMDGEIRHFLNGKLVGGDEFREELMVSLVWETGISVESQDSMILTDQLMMPVFIPAPLLMKRFQ